MIPKILLPISKTPSQVKRWQTSVACLKNSSGIWGTFCSFYPHLRLETVFPALKLARNYIDMNFFLVNCQFNHKLAVTLLHTCYPDRLTPQSDKI